MINKKIADFEAQFDPIYGLTKTQFKSIMLLTQDLSKLKLSGEVLPNLALFLKSLFANPSLGKTLAQAFITMQPLFAKNPGLEKTLERLLDLSFYGRYYGSKALELKSDQDTITLFRQFALKRNDAKLALKFADLNPLLLKENKDLMEIQEQIQTSFNYVKQMEARIQQAPVTLPLATEPGFFKEAKNRDIFYLLTLAKLLSEDVGLKPSLKE